MQLKPEFSAPDNHLKNVLNEPCSSTSSGSTLVVSSDSSSTARHVSSFGSFASPLSLQASDGRLPESVSLMSSSQPSVDSFVKTPTNAVSPLIAFSYNQIESSKLLPKVPTTNKITLQNERKTKILSMRSPFALFSDEQRTILKQVC